MINIPKTQELTNAERFCIGLKELAIECYLDSITYNPFGVTKYEFNDGSKVSSLTAHKEAGLIKNNR